MDVSAEENERRQLPYLRYARSNAWDEILIPVRPGRAPGVLMRAHLAPPLALMERAQAGSEWSSGYLFNLSTLTFHELTT